MTIGLIMFGVMLIMLVIGVPIGLALGIGTVFTMITTGSSNLYIIVQQRMFAATNSFPLMAIPFFVLAGNLMETGGISRRIVNFFKMLLRRQHAASASITTVASAFFGAISGSGPATTAAIGGLMIPSMKETGYKPAEAAAIAAASGILGVIIPPSIPMVTYATTAGVSVGTMFIAGIVPGLLLCLAYILVHQLQYRRVETATREKIGRKVILHTTLDALWALGMPLIILGGIYGGIFTPTEAAAVACVYAFLVGKFVYQELGWKDIGQILAKSAKTTAAIMFIIAVASPFGWLMTKYNVPNAIATAILTTFNSKFIVFLMVNLFLLFLGCFMDTQSIILIVTPLLLPIAKAFGMDGITLGIIIIVNTAIGMMTPPMAINFFVANSIAGLKSVVPITKKIWPYLVAAIAVLLILTYWDGFVMFVPKLLGATAL